MKTRTKSIIALMIALFAVLIIGATKVNAVEVTDEVWNSIPNEISVNVKESEYQKANDIVKSQIIEILKRKGVTVSEEDTTLYVYIDYISDIHKVNIRIEDKSKQITVTYSNSADYNESEKQKLDNIIKKWYKEHNVEEIDGGYTVTLFSDLVKEDNGNSWEQYYIEQFLKEQGYEIVSEGLAGGGTAFEAASHIFHNIFKNGIKYGSIKSEINYETKITIPADIEENKIPQYITDKINAVKDQLAYEGLSKINKVEKSEGNYYIVHYIDKNNNQTNYVLLVKREDNSIITKEDKETKIKLETTTAVVPSNTILSSVTVTEQKTLDTVSKALKDISKYKVYDINLLKDGAKIQPNGKVKISIPIPSDYNKSKLEVYRIDSNGATTKYNVTVNGEFATFETDHFSIYVLADTTQSNTSNNNNQATTNNNRELDETPKTGIQDITYIITAVVIISAVGIIATIKRKQSKH